MTERHLLVKLAQRYEMVDVAFTDACRIHKQVTDDLAAAGLIQVAEYPEGKIWKLPGNIREEFYRLMWEGKNRP